jgi:YggT family protein
MMAVLLRAVFSWLSPRARTGEFYAFLFSITEPALRPVRRLLPASGGMDFSPLIVIVLLEFVSRALR